MKNTYAGALTLNTKNFAIEMDKKFAAAAANVFSAEYEKLQEVRRAYPNYKVVTVARKEKTSGTSGLTFEFILRPQTAAFFIPLLTLARIIASSN